MAFTGRVYWQEYQQVISYWDSSTGVIRRLVITDPALPSGVSDAGYFGNLTLLPDGRILSYLDQRFGDWAVVLDADLNPESAELWTQPAVSSNYAYYDGAQGILDVDNAVVWFPWFQQIDSTTGTLLAAFDATGAKLDVKQTYDDNWAVFAFSWNYAFTEGNGVLNGSEYYRMVQSRNWVDRYDLSTGTWSIARGFLADSSYIAPVGAMSDGQILYLNSLSPSRLCTVDGDPWVPIATSSPGSAPYPTVTQVGSSFATSGSPGTVQILSDHAYYPAGSWGTSRWVDQDLSTGVEATLFDVAEVYLLEDGTPTTSDDPDWYYDLGNASSHQGAILVPRAAPELNITGQLDRTRVRFI